MFSHIIDGVDDLEACKRFYDALLDTLGIKPDIYNHTGVAGRNFYRTPAQGVVAAVLIAACAYFTRATACFHT